MELDLEEPPAAGRSPSPPGPLSATASLPSLPSGPALAYSSKFARSLSRRSSRSEVATRLGEQLEEARAAARRLEQRAGELLTQVEVEAAGRLQAEAAVLVARRQLQELEAEHDNLKDDFRALVRSAEERKSKEERRSKEDRRVRRSVSAAGEDAGRERRRQEGLDVRLGAAIHQLRLREEEMEGVAGCLDTVTLQLCQREEELAGLRDRVGVLELQLAVQGGGGMEGVQGGGGRREEVQGGGRRMEDKVVSRGNSLRKETRTR